MKRFLFVLCLFLALAVCAYAHPGNTDSKGGHYNRTTGEYHYHHGNPAHQHVNGFCPYATVTPTPRATPKPTPKATVKIATLPPSTKATPAPSSSKSSSNGAAMFYTATGSAATILGYGIFKATRK